MALAAIVYNLVMLGVGAAALIYLRGRYSFFALARVFLIVMLAACVIAGAIGPNMFGAMHLIAYAVFAHGPLLLTVFAILTWKQSKVSALIFAGAAVVAMVIAVDAFLIEPHWLQTTRVRLVSPKVKESIRIAIIADLQTDQIGAYERDALRRVVDEKPDMILFAGDYLQTFEHEHWEQLAAELNSYLREIEFDAPLGVYAVGGNCDRGEWPQIFAGLPVQTFTATSSETIAGITITGLSMRDSFETGLRIAPVEGFHIVLGHAPNFARGDVQADLLVAGHTHGGQVALPLFGPLLTMSRVPRRWASGVNEIRPGRTLIVPRGIGMERLDAPRLRFLCRPELVIVEVAPQ